MSPRAFPCAAVVAFVLMGCLQSSPALANCTPNNCRVVVTVTGNCSNPNDITVDQDPLPVPKANHNQKIDWDIQTNGFKWVPAPKGITFTVPPIPPATEFTHPHDNGTKYDLTDANSPTPNGQPIDYKYDIHLQRADGTLCAVKDPTIRNGS